MSRWKITKEDWNDLNNLEKILKKMQQYKSDDFPLLMKIGERLEGLKEQERKERKEEKKKREQERRREREEHYKKEGWFPWPSTDAPASKHGYRGTNWGYKASPQQGILSYVGYHVGKTEGVDRETRREILQCVFHNELPQIDSQAYMNEWGDREQPKRLEKMAYVIAELTISAKLREISSGDNMKLAINDWEEDLEYLRKEYYEGKYDFYWPGTDD